MTQPAKPGRVAADGSSLFLGIDVGSVTAKFVVTDTRDRIVLSACLRNKGSPIDTVKAGLHEIRRQVAADAAMGARAIHACGATGSARYLVKAVAGADIAKTEILAHAVAAQSLYPGVRTILEVGGQDSKIILLQDGIVVDFAMNSVCAAGTGSFLDHQAARLGLPIEQFGDFALRAQASCSIAGRCTVFAESDMIHKQNAGYTREDIIAGLCDALVRNYLNNLAKGRSIEPPIVFQGGVSSNRGIVAAFERHLGQTVIVPEHNVLMGALGVAILAREHHRQEPAYTTRFRGLDLADQAFDTSAFHCDTCANRCEIVQVKMPAEADRVVARWGDRCGKWEVF